MEYTDQTTIEANLKRELSDQEAAGLSTLLGAIKEFIDTYTGRSFGVEENTEEEERFYYGNNAKRLYIDDAVSISSVKSYTRDGLSNIYLQSDWDILPLNSDVITAIYKVAGCWCGYKYGITGVFGIAEVPASIKQAATLLAVAAISNPQGFKSENLEGAYSYSLDTAQIKENEIVKNLLDSNRKVMM